MSHLAFLAPVGPFAGLSNSARQQIGALFPDLSLAEVESAAATFLRDLEAPATEPRLAEARSELSIFAKEIARFHGALDELRKHRLDHAIGEASRAATSENAVENLERALTCVRAAVRRAVRAIPLGRSELASRRLIAALARQAGHVLPPQGGADHPELVGLVEIIFDDLMIGGDAAVAVGEWHRSEVRDVDRKCVTAVFEH